MNSLTRREREIVLALAEGLSNKWVGRKLNISEGTVKIHLHSIYRKLRVSSRSELILRVFSNGRKLPKLKRAFP